MECNVCNKSFDRIGGHWNRFPQHAPVLGKYQREIITGTLMGDACVQVFGKNPTYTLTNKKEKYINYVRNNLSCIDGGGIHKDKDDVYRWSSITHWGLRNYYNWYSSGKKVFPSNINLTKTVLKHWYACDGTLENGGKMRIAMSNERKNKEKIEKYFVRSGLPKPNYWLENKRLDSAGYRCRACWNKNESQKLLDWMGKPLPAYEYKWKQQV